MTDRVPARTVFTLILVCLSIEAAAYLSAASMHVTGWPSTGVQTVALLPPLGRLSIGVILAPLVVGLSLLAARWWNPAATRRERAAWTAHALSPLVLLLIWALPYVPRLVHWVPAVVMFAGPAKWVILALAILGCAPSPGEANALRLPDAVGPPRWAVRLRLFAVSLLVYLAIGVPFTRAQGPGGDEPHYLVIAQSLLADHDLQIENNHRLRQYSAFVTGDLPPHFLHRGRNGVIYSVHAPGLPVLLLPGFALAGYLGAVVIMAVLGALVALAVYDLASLVADSRSAALTWIAIAFTVPLAPHAWLIFPELPAALLAAWTALWLWRPLPRTALGWMARGVALAFWPWLHTKFLLLLVVAVALLLLRLRTRTSHVIAFVGPIAASLGLWVFSFWVMYGVASPFVPYGSSGQGDLAIANIPRAILGFLFDYKFGVLLYSPIYLVAVIGVWKLLADSRWRWFTLALVSLMVTLLASVAPYYMWWGGRSAPGRFVVPAIPLLAPIIAAGIAAARQQLSKAIVTLLIVWSVAVFGLMALGPNLSLLFNDRQAPGRLVALLQGDAPLSYALPTFAQPDYLVELRKVVIWIIAVAVGVVAAATFRRKGGLFRLTVSFLAVLWATGATVSAVTMSRSDRDLVVNEGRMRLVADYDDRAIAVEYPSLRRLSTGGLLRRCMLSVETIGIRERHGERPVLAGPFDLQPGRYIARVWFRNSQREYHGAIALTDRPTASRIARRDGPFRNPIEVPFVLPVSDSDVRVEASDWTLASETVLVEIEPRSLTARSSRPSVGVVRLLSQIDDREGAYVVYVDDSTFPEGEFYWTKGSEPGRMLVSPAGARRLRLTLHLGPAGGDVNVEVGEHRERLSLSPGEVRVWDGALDPTSTLVPVTVTASGGFRPAAVDPRSTDHRWLGCQVRTELQDQ